LRCIHCNVFAYHDTVKQLAKNRAYQPDIIEASPSIAMLCPIGVEYGSTYGVISVLHEPFRDDSYRSPLP
jgi:hypothetical protein